MDYAGRACVLQGKRARPDQRLILVEHWRDKINAARALKARLQQPADATARDKLSSVESFEDRASRAVTRFAESMHRHPNSIMAAVLVVLLGTAATAFGIAPMAPDASNLPKRVVTEDVNVGPLDRQLDALAGHELRLYRSDVTRPSDTADSLLRRVGVDDLAAASFLRTNALGRKLLDNRAGKMVRVSVNADGSLEELTARYPAETASQLNTHFTRLRIARNNDKLEASLETVPLDREVRLGSGTVQTTLFAATDDANLPDNVAGQLSEMFSTEIDFRHALHKGDTFTVLYETPTADGELVAWGDGTANAGRVLAAEFVNAGQAHESLWFQGSNGKGAYFGLDGANKHRAFLSTPLEFSRITSGMSMRMHPILQQWRQHQGVDYAAAMGTAVHSVAEGIVEFAGWQNGYGNIVEIKHDKDRETRYAHLSRVDVKVGQHVMQNEKLGAVGMTGWATGPHLHFEFRIDGEVHDPLTIAQTTETVAIAPADKPRFMALAASTRAQLEAADNATQIGVGD